jgi:hypothetical protein
MHYPPDAGTDPDHKDDTVPHNGKGCNVWYLAGDIRFLDWGGYTGSDAMNTSNTVWWYYADEQAY